jgi:hypothetical protein
MAAVEHRQRIKRLANAREVAALGESESPEVHRPQSTPATQYAPLPTILLSRRLLLGLLLAVLGLLCLLVLWPFLSPIAWAAIIAYVTWPAYGRLQRALARSEGLIAARSSSSRRP